MTAVYERAGWTVLKIGINGKKRAQLSGKAGTTPPRGRLPEGHHGPKLSNSTRRAVGKKRE